MTAPAARPHRRRLLFWSLWYLISLVTLLLVPAVLKLRQRPWDLPAPELVQVLVLAIGFLAFALLVRLLAEHPSRLLRLALTGLGIVVCFAAPSALLLRSGLPVSRVLLLLMSVLGIALGMAGGLLVATRYRWVALSALVLLVVAAGLAKVARPANPIDRIANTEYHGVRLKLHRITNLPPGRPRSGGGIAPLGDGFLLVTGDAQFYRLEWRPGPDSLLAVRLPLRAPLNRAEFLQDQANAATATVFRITDLAVDQRGPAPRVYVAHRSWNRAERCITTRVSTTTLEPAASDGSGPGAWQTIFESQPCLSVERSVPRVAPLEDGGALALHPSLGVLVSLGDNGFDGTSGEEPFPQRRDVSYGKIMRIMPDGGVRLMSLGHRNPQGLAVDQDGRIWEAEHGPQGGDEINLIEEGKNYGWPLATYGTEYGLSYWPMARTARDHGAFQEPAHVFVPSIGISQLISVRGTGFPRWAGDLLVASLRREALYRVRLRDTWVTYVEPILVGARIRDLAEGRDGRILLWTDEGEIISASPAPAAVSGSYIFEVRCSGCHEPPPGGVRAAGPDLHGVVSRRVAGDRRFGYSEALRQLGGRWSRERLIAFLRDPAAYAPGTTMGVNVAEEDQRKAVVEYLGTSYR